jgi:FtsP/CotA-like multicopper oxidase with cupredoxin domain
MRGHDMPGEDVPAKDTTGAKMPGHDMQAMRNKGAAGAVRDAGTRTPDSSIVRTTGLRAPGTVPETVMHGPDKHGPTNASTPMSTKSRLHEPGFGLGNDGWRVLLYEDLRSLKPVPDFRPPEREIEMHLTGNMERFIWSINGIKFSDVEEPLRLRQGERLRLTMVNDSMMQHPMHLHGMWMELENGAGRDIPRVHTINVKPAERLSVLVTPNDPGPWAFHCHILYHMEVGMFRVIEVSGGTTAEARP